MPEYAIALHDRRVRKKGYEVSVMKVAMDLVRLIGGPVRSPVPSMRLEDVKEVRAVMKK